MDPLVAVLSAAVLGTLVVSAVVLRRLDRTRGPWTAPLRERFVLGVPWGTLVVVAFVLSVYLFVQDGVTAFADPVTIPYRSWSYFYPVGMLTAAFSHASPGHLIGNLSGTLVLAPVVEYVWGHYPRDDDSVSLGDLTSVADLRRTPAIRALVLFPLAVVAVGLLTSFFAVGPVIGFSGVVFAFAGVALVRYPITTLLLLLGVQGVLVTIYRALQSPILVTVAQPSPPSAPSWATVAIQGHAFGLFVGILVGAAIVHRRRFRPDPVRLWFGLLVFGFVQGLWQLYWYGDEGTYVLFRGPGVAIVSLLALLVTVALTASERSLVPDFLRRRPTATDGPSASAERAVELANAARTATRDATARFLDRTGDLVRGTRSAARADTFGTGRRSAAVLAILVVFAVITGPAIPLNLFVLDGEAESEATVTVDDYAVTYDEGVENRLISAIPFEAFADEASVETSGVIVWSEERNLWTTPVTDSRLAFTGEETVTLGGPGWRSSVSVEREGWTPVGNESVYRIWLSPDDGDETLAYASDPGRADVVVADTTFAVVPDGPDDSFGVAVTVDGEESVVAVPIEGESVDVGTISLSNENGTLYVEADGTRAAIASEETYPGS